jgi:hypothetical protein
MLPSQKPHKLDKFFKQIFISYAIFYPLLKFGQTWWCNKQALLKILPIPSRISSLFFTFFKNQKELKFVVTKLHITHKFQQNRLRKVFVALMGEALCAYPELSNYSLIP